MSGAVWSVSGCPICSYGALTTEERRRVGRAKGAVRGGTDMLADWPLCSECRAFWDGMAYMERFADGRG